MTHATLSSTPYGIESMQHAWQGLRQKKPGVRVRDAAALLGVSEAQLVASGCGHTATRLAGDWATLIEALPSLGRVMALTRNDHAIHEQTGAYRNVRIVGNMGLVLGEAIDLRLFLGHWHYGFAVEADSRSGATESLQFFDGDGTAVQKVYLTERSDRLAYAWVVSKPTVSGPVTSLELYDFAGNTIALLYGKRKPGYPENPVWRALVTGLPTVVALP